MQPCDSGADSARSAKAGDDSPDETKPFVRALCARPASKVVAPELCTVFRSMMFRRSESVPLLDGDVRRARQADIPRLVELWRQLMVLHEEADPRFTLAPDATATMRRRFQYLIQERDVLVLVSVSNGSVVGFAIGHVDPNLPFMVGSYVGFISDLFVEEPFRNQGRARRLVAALRSWFVTRKVSSIQLHAASCNPAAHEFWAKMGFKDYLVRMTAAP